MLTFFIRRPRFAMVIALLLTFVGAVSLKLIPVEQYPAITPPVVNVSASWPGASASDVAEAIAAPLETQLNGVDHMLYMESTSSDEGTYRLSITFAAGTDADLAAIDVQNRVAQALAQLPAEVQQNGVQVRKRASNLLMGVSLYSPLGTLSPLFVSNYASTQVREALARLPGVGEVQMFGARDYSMRIWLRPDRMNALNITTDDVAQALREQNVQGAAGQVGTPPVFNGQQQTLTINGLGRLNEAASFGEIILRRGAQGQLVRLADVATIELGARSYSSGAQLNGKASAYLGIYPTPTANALQVASAVRAELNRLHTRFPADLTWEVKFDTTRFVAATIKEIGVSLALTLLAVVVVVSLFLQSWRATLIVVLAIPVSLIGTFAVLYLLGYSANTLSLFAIILALTMVVDDAIVVVENVETKMAEGLDRLQATAQALRQIAGPVIATTLVLLAVFVPMNEYIQQSLKSCFFNVDIKVVEWNTLFTNWRLGARDPSAKGIDAINVSAAVNDPYFGLIRFSTAKAFPPVATNWGYFSTPETEKLAAAVKHAFTPAEMNKAAGELHAALVDQVPFLFVAHDVGPRAISPAVTGVVQPQSWFIDLSLVSKKE